MPRLHPLLLAPCRPFPGAASAGPPGDAHLGTWVAPDLQPVPAPDGSTAYLRRSVIFAPEKEDVLVEAFFDAAATQPIFTYRSSGPYSIGQASAAVPGAWEIDLTNDSSAVTIFVDAPDLWQGLNLAACPLAIGQAVEIAACVSGPPFIASSCVDMDLLSVDGDRLRFGVEETDRCTTRPAALDDLTYIRQPGG